MSLRVAFDGRSLASTVLRGWDRYAVGLVGELVRQGVDVTLFHRDRQALHAPHVADLGCRVVGLRDRGGRHWEQVAVPMALRRGRFDLFHAPFEHGVPLISPRPVVLTIHSVTILSYEDMVRRGLLPGRASDYLGHAPHPYRLSHLYVRAQYARAAHILTPSEFCRDEVIRLLGVPPGRVTATLLGLHEQFRRPARPPADRAATLEALGVRRPYLLYVGGYEAHKNVEGLLRAFALVHEARPDLSLTLVGSTPAPEDVGRLAVELGLRPGRDVVLLAGLADELTDLYDESSLVVSLSWRETFCLPLLEAMSRGVSVVASSWGASPEVVGDLGRLVDPRDHRAAGEAILGELLEAEGRPDRRVRIRERALQFDWKRTAAETLDVYSRLIGRGR